MADLTFLTLGEVEATTSSDNYQPQGHVNVLQDFMKNFNPKKVTIPGQLPVDFEPGKDPFWVTPGWENGSAPPQLIDPIGNRPIAYYCYEFAVPCFYGRGYFRRNPRNELDYQFVMDGNHAPYKDLDDGKLYTLFF